MKTHRQQIMQLLEQGPVSARDISQSLRIREKEVYDHLGHVGRSLAGQGRKLTVLPFACLKCGYIFKERKRFTRPGRCPRCKRTYLEEPLIVIQ
jgi:predicted Zn-ribbon and HTH transcriptional regulator